jgi:HAE1 family hydrophobic/amphiphilic exporter-1
MKLSEFAIYKPISTIMVVISIMVMGFISLFRLPLEYLPSLTFPRIYVSVNYPSSSPEEIEQFITRPIEEILGTMSGVESISSSSSGSSARVGLEFAMDADMDIVGVHIRDRIDQVRADLPADVDRIDIRSFDTEDFPILEYSLTWLGENNQELVNVFNQIILPRVQRLDGVANVALEGLREKDLLIEVDQKAMAAYKMDFRTINRALNSNNINVSAGYVTEGSKRFAVRSMGEFETVDQIRDLPIRPNLILDDVADVTYDYPESRSFERLDGRPSLTLEVQKASTANMVDVCKLAHNELALIQEEVGKDKLRIHLVRDRSIDVTNSITSLSQSAILGGLLAIIAIFIFLRNFRSTLIIGSAIPISVLTVFLIMYFMRQAGSNITLNLISMMGLMVAIGMLVDPAVVALENIFRKRYEEGQGARQAALEGSDEIGLPVLAASLTTICVFIPVIFVTDSRTSLFMRDFAITVIISVIASFCIALSLIPLAASRAFNEDGKIIDRILKSIVGLVAALGLGTFIYYTDFSKINYAGLWANFNTTISALPAFAKIGFPAVIALVIFLYIRYRAIGPKALYAKLVSSTLHYRWATISAACVLLFLGNHIYGKVEQQPFRYQPTRSVRLTIEMPRSYDVDKAREVFKIAEGILIPLKNELDIEAIGSRYSGRRGTRLTLYLTPADEGKLTTDEVQRKVMALLPTDIPGVRFKSGGGGRGGSSVGAGVQLKGRNQETLAILAEDIETSMQGMPGVHEIQTSLESGTEEIRVTVNRERAQRYGLSPRDIANTIASALGSRGGSNFKTPDGEIDITVLLREEDRATLEQLKTTEFESDNGGMVTFSSLANFDLTTGSNTIRREDRMSTVTVFANTDQQAVFRVGRIMKARMEGVPLPKGYTYEMDRRFRSMNAEQNQDYETLILALVLIYIIMASLFESYVHPLTIMFCIFFAFIGVALGLYTFKIAMDSNAKYGLLVLFGIVVNNGIVLVDHINRYRKQGVVRRDAIIRGGQDRLRPIMMTATTTIIGLMPLVLPMLFGNAEGTSRRWGPIGLVVISGLSISTILTLVLLPTVYSLMDDLSQFAKRVTAVARAQ